MPGEIYDTACTLNQHQTQYTIAVVQLEHGISNDHELEGRLIPRSV